MKSKHLGATSVWSAGRLNEEIATELVGKP